MKNRQASLRIRPQFEELEPRILYSADAAALLHPDAITNSAEVRMLDLSTSSTNNAPAAQVSTTKSEIVFVDTRVKNYQQLIDDINSQNADGRNIEVKILDNQLDGVQQIANALAGRKDISAIHLIAEGNTAELLLGSSLLNQDSLSNLYAKNLADIGKSLTQDADILVYGCNFGRGTEGELAMQTLADLTGADIAASSDRTGHSTEFANWKLEVNIGNIETDVAVSAWGQKNWFGALSIFIVSNTNDSGIGSFRQAVNNANSNAGTDTVAFVINGTGIHTINLLSTINVSEAVIIDGTTDDSFLANGNRPVIVLNGGGTVQDGIQLYAGSSGSTVRGIVFKNFTQDAIDIASSDNNTIVGNWFGVNNAGTAAASNQQGINIWDSSNNIIGGTTAADRNVISGSTGCAIFIGHDGLAPSNNNQIIGNYIGTNVAGNAAIGNNYGIFVQNSANTIIGKSVTGAGNVISASTHANVTLYDLGTTGSIIQSNYIGTNATGTADIDGSTSVDGSSGVVMDAGASNNLVGTNADGVNDSLERNIISGNNWFGVEMVGAGTDNNQVQGNYIGTDVTGTASLGNSQGGASFWDGAANNTIGGSLAGTSNLISGNLGMGILSGLNAPAGAPTGNNIKGNYIGTDVTGTLALGNASYGIFIDNGNFTTIGGTSIFERNIISGNGDSGVYILGANSNDNTLLGNYIGTNASGTAAIGNAGIGVYIDGGASRNQVGSAAIGGRNVVSGNTDIGISVDGNTTTDNIIIGNYIGLNAAGNAAISNGAFGIAVDFNAKNTQVGGTAPSEGNVISGNTGTVGSLSRGGIYIFAESTTVQGNIIGLSADKSTIIANGGAPDINGYSAGIFIPSATGTTIIGGTSAGAANTIAGNIGAGIASFGSNVSILGNNIYSNTALGIDLEVDGITINDANDTDGLQNFPVLSSAISTASDTTISGTFNSIANTAYRIEFFSNPSGSEDASGYGEGKTYLGYKDITTDGAGNITFSMTLLGVTLASGDRITATATEKTGATTYAATSEFAMNVIAAFANTPPAGIDGSINVREDTDYVFTLADFGFTDVDGNSLFRVNITSLPTQGTLKYLGAAFSAGNYISLASLQNGEFTYSPPANANGNALTHFTFQIQDDGGTANGGVDTDQSPNTLTINVSPVNDAPSILFPNAVGTNPNQALVFSSTNSNSIIINDIDVGTGMMSLQISVLNGTLTLSQVTGLSFSVGDGNSDNGMTFQGSFDDINAALEGLTYQPNNGYTGFDTLGISVDDLGNTGSGGALTSSYSFNILVDNSQFLQGNFLEVGINSTGSIGALTPAPAGFVNAGSNLGVIADSGRDGWATYNGDYILPGSPQEEWGVNIGGTTFTNSTDGIMQNIAGASAATINNGNTQSVLWSGNTSGLNISNNFSVSRNDLFMDVTVTLTNTTGAAMTDIYYYRSADADNNYRLNANYLTTNTVLSQGNDGSGIAFVSATQADGSFMGLQGFGSNARVAYGNFSLINPVDAYSGINGNNATGSNTADEAITLVYKVNTLAAGESVTLNMRYVFTDQQAPVLDLDANDSNTTGTGYQTTYVENAAPVKIADSDATLKDIDSANLQSMTATISNLKNGANEILSADTTGTSIIAAYNNGVLTLTGNDTVANYEQVLRTITYTNTSDNPDTTQRIITIVANDGVNNSNIVTSAVDITAVNDAPTITAVANQAAEVGRSTAPITFSVGDIETNANALTLSVTSANQTLLANSAFTITGSGAQRQLTILSGIDTGGASVPVTITVSDGTTATTTVLQVTVATPPPGQTILTTGAAPTQDFIDASPHPWELGTIFTPDHNGMVTHVRVYVNASESGDHTVRLWNNDTNTEVMAPITWNYGGVNGWITLDIPDVAVQAGTNYTISISTGTDATFAYAYQSDFFTANGNNGGNLSYPAGAGVFDTSLGVRPTQVYGAGNNPSYFRDVVFTPTFAAPLNSLPSTVTANEDIAIAISGISVSDADGDLTSVKLSVTNGVLYLGLTGNATITSGASGTASFTLTGSSADINASLAKLLYLGNLNFTGADVLTVLSTDSSGLVDTDNLAINVSAINDAPSFRIGNDGTVTTPINLGSSGFAMAIQPDGKIVEAGQVWNGTDYDFAVTRYNANGSLDTGFGVNGIVTTQFSVFDDGAKAIVIQPDGKIVVSGYSNSGPNWDVAIARYNANGTLDNTFGVGGKVISALSAGGEGGYGVALQADGKIVVGGDTWDGSKFILAVTRYNTNGTLDTSFNGSGTATTSFAGSTDAEGTSVTVQADGKILLAGYNTPGGNNDFALVRFNVDGSLDTSFGVGGQLTTDFDSGSDTAYSVKLQADGKILVAGESYNNVNNSWDFSVARYNSNGTLDTSFGVGGKVLTDFGQDDHGQALAIQSDGKILVSGYISNGNDFDFGIVRYNTDGTLDTSFSGDGRQITAVGTFDDYVHGMAIQADGKIVVAGDTLNGAKYDFALARYNADGTLDTTFNSTNTLDGNPTYIENGAPVVLDNNVQIFDAELSALDNFNGATLTLNRAFGTNVQDIFSATGTLSSLTQGSSLIVSGVTVGTVSINSIGILALTFNSNATNTLVNSVMQQIAYSNSSDNPPASVQINWTFNDGVTIPQGTGGALTVSGNVIVNITPVNDAPILTPYGPTYNTSEGAAAITTTVASVLSSSISDIDTGAVQGMALYGVSGTGGVLEYSINGGSSWVAVGSVSSTSALLLSANDLVRFTPDTVNGGTMLINYRAWDQTTGINGTKVDASLTGGTSAFSVANDRVTVNISSVNDAPISTISPTNYSATEQTLLTLHGTGLSLADVDAGSAIIQATITVVSGSLNAGAGTTGVSISGSGSTNIALIGTTTQINDLLSGNLGGTLTYIINSDAPPATDTLSLTVNDLGNTGAGGALTATDSATIDITPVNDAPTTTPVTLVPIAEDSGARVITQAELLANAADVDTPLVNLVATGLSIATGAGSLVDNGNGTWTYTPALNDDTTVNFSYTINDGNGGTTAGAANLDITPVNDPPTNSPVTLVSIAEDSGARVITAAELLANAADVDDVSLTVLNLTINSGNGTLVSIDPFTWTYTPGLNDDTAVTFHYDVYDGHAVTPGIATLDITPIDDAPTTSPVTLAPIAEDSGTRLITQAELLANASDIDTPLANLVASGLSITTGAGSLIDNGNGTWTFAPALNDDTGVSFTYTISDGSLSAVGSATLDITPINDAPTSSPVTLTPISEDSGARIITQAELLANASDVDTPLANLVASSLSIATSAGSLVDNGNGTWTYTPALNDDTAVSFSYTINDGSGSTVAGTANLDITPVNDAPIASNVSLNVLENNILNGFLPIATDVEGDAITYSLGSTATHGIVSVAANGAFSYNPNANYNGADSFTYTISDGNGGTNTYTVSINIISVNSAPTASNASINAIEDTLFSGTLPTASDIEGDPITYSLSASALHGTVNVNANGDFTYAPSANYNGADNFTYTVTDSLGASNTYTISISVAAVNDAPLASDDSVTGLEDNNISGNVLTNDSDVENSTLTAILVTGPANGTLTLNANGSFIYTPNTNWNGTDTFTYKANDGSADSNIASVTITVTPQNDSPTTSPVTLAAIIEDSGAHLITQAQLLANAADVDGDTLTVTNLAISAGNGVLVDNLNGTWTYTPGANDDTSVSFSYNVTDGSLIAAGVANLDITPVNDAPTGANSNISVLENTTYNGTLPVATDVEGDPINYTLSTGASHGSVSVNTNGSFIYTPAAFYSGPDSFSYTIDDGNGGNNTYTVTINSVNVNDPPTASNTTINAVEDTLYSGILPVATDPDLDPISYTLNTGALHGTVNINTNGNFTYAPTANYNGADSFTYTVSDGLGGANTYTVSINVAAVNDAPVANNDSVTGLEDNNVTGNVLTNDSDVDSPVFTAILVSSPTNGSIAFNSNGSFTYTPNANWNGTETFTYQANDGSSISNIATVTIIITPINDAPTTSAVTLNAVLQNSGAHLITQAELLANAADVDGNTLAVTNLDISSGNGVLVNNLNGTWTYTLASSDGAAVSFSYTVTDGSLTAAGTANMDIIPVIAPPPPPPPPVTPTTVDPVTLPPAPKPVITDPPTPTEAEVNNKPITNTTVSAITTAIDSNQNVIINLDSNAIKNANTLASRLNQQDVTFSVIDLIQLPSTTISNTVTEVFSSLTHNAQIQINAIEFNEPKSSPTGQLGKIFFDNKIALTSVAVSAGLVAWAAQYGILFSSVLASLPAWRNLDPVAILGNDDEDEDTEWDVPDDENDQAAEDNAIEILSEKAK